MADKKYLDENGLVRFLANIINTFAKKTDLTSGDVTVAEAEHATSADTATSATTATNANHATSADTATNANHATTADSATTATSATSATKATQDGNGKVIADTYETIASADAREESLTELIDGKADASHTHTIANITNLQSTLDSKASSSHSHSAATTTAAGFMSAADKEKLDGIAEGANNYTYTLPAAGTSLGGVKSGGDVTISSGVITVNDDSHNHIISNVDGLQDALDGKAASSHTHTIANVTDLQDELDSLESSIAGKSDSGHTHTIANITNLQSSLDAKVPTSRTVNGKALTANITLSASDVGADASGAAANALTSAKSYADSAAATVKNDLLNGAGTAYDTLKELGDLIDDNADAIDALETVAAGKADKSHTHTVSEISDLTATATELNYMDGVTSNVQTQLNAKAASSHTHSAYVNQNAFSNVKVGDTTVAADTTTDTLTLVGSNVTLTPDADNDKVTIGITKANVTSALGYTPPTTNTTYSVVSTSADGLAPKRDGSTTTFLRGDGTWAVPPDTNTTYSVATTSANGLMSSSDKTKLNGIATGAEVNQNAFANVKIGDTTIAADAKSDTLTLVAGSNVTLTPNADGDSITIASTDTNTVYTHPTYTARTGVPTGNQTPAFGGTFSVTQPVSDGTGHITAMNSRTVTIPSTAATQSAAGLMSAADKTKLDGVATGANNYTLPAATSDALGGVKIGSNITNSSGTISLTKANVTSALGYTPPTSDTNTTYSAGTGISLSGTTFSNSGVRSIATGSSNGTISVNTNGTSADVAVKGLGSAAYTASSAYAAASHTHNYAASTSAGGAAISMSAVTTAGDGAAYTATVTGITALTAGVSFIMNPHTNSTTTTPTLNVNSLGAKGIRMRGSSATGTAMTAAITAWLASGRPVQVTYNGIYWLAEVTRPAASDLSGTVAIANGGTGATTASAALTNLGAAASDVITVSSTEPTSSTCMLWVQI